MRFFVFIFVFITLAISGSVLSNSVTIPTSQNEVTAAPENEIARPEDNAIIRPTMRDWNSFYAYLLAMRLALQERELQTRFNRPTVKKDCQPVGGFCTYHEDCCSFACLTYLKRCVSG